MTLTWNGKQFDWVNVGWFTAIHAGALLAPWTFTWTGLGVLGMFSWGLAMVLFFRVMERLDVTQVSLSIYLLPFFGVLLSALMLGERLSGSIIVGGILALLGTGLIILEDSRTPFRPTL